MHPHINRLCTNLRNAIERKQAFLGDLEQLNEFSRAVDLIVSAYKKGGRLYIAGNGGSAADAQHLAAEFGCKLSRARDPIAAESMTVDTSLITSVGNDFGFDEIFARQVSGKMRPEDIFLGITTSGRSKNIIRALERCRERGIHSVALTGNGGGDVRNLADVCIIAPGKEPSDIQEVHIVIYHTLCACIESAIIGL